MKISIIAPVKNEEQNLELLKEKLSKVMNRTKYDYEIILVDDGSTDNSVKVMEELAKKDQRLRPVILQKWYGQTAAMDAGIKEAKGEVIVFIDADLQNDPKDIPKLLAKLNEGYDVVAGWRWQRKDPFFKRIISKFANFLRRKLIKEEIHDSGCTLKAIKKKCFEGMDLYGEMHRYIPAFLRTKGYKITEIKTKHHARKKGKTKYGGKRIIKGFLDLIMIYYWTNYASRPMHSFGTVGLINFLLGFIIGAYLLVWKFYYGGNLAQRPLLMLVVLLIIIGIQFIIFGIIAEILMRIYYKTHKQTYYKKK